MEFQQESHMPLPGTGTLKNINNISFTDREIDIIACLIGDQSSKKIASYLLISHKTVAAHLRNIMLKLGCNSRQDVVDFIKNSEQHLFVKKHYANLLIKITFEKELKNLARLANNINCIIFYYKTQRAKDPFISQLERHLNLAKINVQSKVWEKGKSIQHIFSNIGDHQTNFVVYVISSEFAIHLQKANHSINVEATNVKSLLKENPNPVVFLLLDKQAAAHIKNNPPDFIHLNLAEQGNYYLLVFELLKELLPSKNISKNITEFKKQYEMLHGYSSMQDRPKEIELLAAPQTNNKRTAHPKKLILVAAMIFSLIVCVGIIIIHFTSLSEIVQQKLATPTKNNYMENHIASNHVTKTTEVILFNLPPRNTNFAGRKENLKQIEKYLKRHRFGIITQAISGLGGVGKTQLAAEFAYAAAEKSTYSSALWVAAENTNSIHNSYKETAYHLQLEVKGLGLDNAQTLVHKKLADMFQKSKILFILDNVTSYNNINKHLAKIHKELSPKLTPHILITSRSQHWTKAPLILDVFTTEEALEFVQKYLPNENINTINKLTSTLHLFPLAIGQAIAYIKEHTNIDDYLELYAIKQKDCLNIFSGDKNQYTESLWKTWSIAFDKLSNNAKELLFMSAYLSPDDIPFSFFAHLNTEEKGNAIGELRKYSFITLTNTNKSFKIHRLLQEVIKLTIKHNKARLQNNAFKTESYWLIKAMALLETKFDFDYLQPKQWKYWSNYLSHAQSIANHAIKIPGKPLLQGFKLYIKYAMFLTYIQFDEERAIVSWDKISSLIEQHYKGHVRNFLIANLNASLSYALNYSGNFKKVEELLNNTIAIHQHPLPNIQPKERELLDLLRIISFKDKVSDQMRKTCDLSGALLMTGMAQYSLGFMQKALATYQRAFKAFGEGPLDNISQCYKADALGEIGYLYIYMGEFVNAETILRKANLGENRLLADHPGRAYDYANIALLMYHIGKFQEAIKLLDKCSKIRTANLSPQHIRNTDTNIKLGFTKLVIGNIDAAKKHFIKADSIYKLYRDDNACDYVFTKLGFWKIYEVLGEYNKAKDYMKVTLETSKSHYKDNIHSAMSFKLTQAETWPKLIKNFNASYWQEALETNRQIFGDNHYQTAKYHYMFGQALEHKYKLIEAHDHYQKALAILKVQKISHPNLKSFYIENIKAVQAGLQNTSQAWCQKNQL